MPFQKGHNSFPKGKEKKPRPKNTRPSDSIKENHNVLDIYKGSKEWEKSPSRQTLNQEEVDYYIYNNLDLNELYDELKLYDYRWKEGSPAKKEYMKEYQRNRKNK